MLNSSDSLKTLIPDLKENPLWKTHFSRNISCKHFSLFWYHSHLYKKKGGGVLGAGRQAAENCHINKPSHKWDSYIIPFPTGSGTILESERFLRAKSHTGSEQNDVFWTWQEHCTHANSGCGWLHKMHTRSSMSAFQQRGRRGSWAPHCHWGARDSWWLLGRKSQFSLSGDPWQVYYTPTTKWLQTHEHMGSTDWTWWVI